MKEINIAYGILSDKEKRKAYDEELKASGRDKEFNEETSENGFEDYFSQDDADWDYAIEYFPKIKEYFEELKEINTALAFAFRQGLLEYKKFEQAEKYFLAIKEDFLSRYFGTNPSVRKIVEFCIKKNNKDVLREINKAVSILGDSLDVSVLEKKLRQKFGFSMQNPPKETRGASEEGEKVDTAVSNSFSSKVLWLSLGVLFVFFVLDIFSTDKESQPYIKKDANSPALSSDNSNRNNNNYRTEKKSNSDSNVTGKSTSQQTKYQHRYYELAKPFVSKVANSRKVMSATVAIMTRYDEQVIVNVERHEYALRRASLDVMGQHTEDDLKKPEFRVELAEKIRITMNALLERYEDFGGIDEVYFTEFVVQ